MNYNALMLFPHKLSIMTFDPIKLPSYDIFPYFVSQRNSQQRYIYISFLPPFLEGISVILVIWSGGKNEKKNFSLCWLLVLTLLTDEKGEKCYKMVI